MEKRDLDSIRDIFRDINLILETWNMKLAERVTEKDIMSIEKSIKNLVDELHRATTISWNKFSNKPKH
jgi:hypothetical protein